VRPTRDDVVTIWVASGKPSELVRLAARAAFLGHEVDLQIEHTRTGCYCVTVTELRGELVVSELALAVDFREIQEPQRLGVLLLWTRTIILDSDRWRRRHEVALAGAIREARARLGIPDG